MAYEKKRAGYVFSDDKKRLDLNRIEAFMHESYWASGRTRLQIERSIGNSLCFGIYRVEDGMQVAFARAVTDCVTFAWLCDVFVDASERGHGLGKMLVESIDAHPDLQGLRRWILATRDAHGLYKQFGYTPLANPGAWMERIATIPSQRPRRPRTSRA